MSASRVENADDMAVDDAEVALPTAEWLQAAQRAAETDGILENTSAKRQKVRICMCTLMSRSMALRIVGSARPRWSARNRDRWQPTSKAGMPRAVWQWIGFEVLLSSEASERDPPLPRRG